MFPSYNPKLEICQLAFFFKSRLTPDKAEEQRSKVTKKEENKKHLENLFRMNLKIKGVY